MRYIFPIDAPDKISILRQQFQKLKNINIDDEPSMIRMPTMFGGIDVKARKRQIVFLEKIHTILSPNLKRLDEITSPEQLPAAITAWRVYLTACWYVQSQNSSGSEFNLLINHDLGITAENFADEEDKDNFYATANRFVNAKDALDDANVALIQAKQRPFTEQEWGEFTEFIAKFHVKKESTNMYTNYPITSITQPLFSATFTYTGATVGLLSGDVISKSTKAMSAKYQLTALIGGSLLMFGPAGPTGVALFAPVIASKLITAFCSITLAHVLGTTMGMLGYGVGTVVGFPLDLAYHLLWKVCNLINNYCHTMPKQPAITGMRLSDGMTIIGGVAVGITSEEELAQYDKKQIIELREDGSMYLGGKPIITSENGLQLPVEVVDQLKEHLKIYAIELLKTQAAGKELESTTSQATTNMPQEETTTCTM